MHFLIIGGTGRNGSLALQEALARGHTVTALIRNTASTKISTHSNLTLVQGTPTSRSDISKALVTPKSPQVIVTALAQVRVTESPFAALHPDTTPDFMAVSMSALLAAITQANLPSIPKIVVNSAQGTGTSWRSMNLPGKLLFSHGSMGIGLKDHNEVDLLVRESGLHFVLARPVMLAEGEARSVKVWTDDGKGCAWMPKITRKSVGKWLVDAAETDECTYASLSNKLADEYINLGFSTVYGMSSPTKGISAGGRFEVYRKGETVLGFTGKGGVIFWFVFENLNHYVPLSRAKRYTAADVEELCRTVVVGHAACKTTPAGGGQGANQAIESCAMLVNKLMEAYHSTHRPTHDSIRLALTSYAKEREQSAAMAMESSQMICNSLFCLQDPTVLNDIIDIGEEDFLLRALMGFSMAPTSNDVEVTAREQFYSVAVHAVKQ
ncbi:hypothetical protein FGRMN_5226 [Fusarium graminum]|nr:hypothetical protein FGRMN_5226 [Fusarium graminum]